MVGDCRGKIEGMGTAYDCLTATHKTGAGTQGIIILVLDAYCTEHAQISIH